MLKNIISIILLFITIGLRAQTYKVKFKITDSENEPLVAAVSILKYIPDSNKFYTATSNTNGETLFSNIPQGPYSLQIRFVGFEPSIRRLFIRENTDLGIIKLKPVNTTLKEAKVEGQAVRAEQLRDTIQFNADAFKVNRDATAEDLVKKVPGITIESGTVKAQGEEVKRVLLDGKDFFADDPMMALRNLPAEIIDKMQVFDRMSEQSQFTRFDDGNSEKTINLTSRRGKANGVFGKIYAGYGTDSRYNAGLNINAFNGNRRLTLLAMTNNINQQNFGFQDIIGISGAGNSMRGGMGAAMMRSGNFNANNARFMPGGGAMSNFMVNQQNGIASTNAIGSNYTDLLLNKKLNVQASYFFNQTNTQNIGELNRQFFVSNLNGQNYREVRESRNDNINHRLNARLQYDIDSNNKIIYTPRISVQQNNSFSIADGFMTDNNGPINNTFNKNSNNNTAINFNNNLQWQRRLNKAGRTLSTSLQADINTRDGDGTIFSITEFAGVKDSAFSFDQVTTNKTIGSTYGISVNYTEPLGKNGLLQLNYNPTNTYNFTERLTYNKPPGATDYNAIDTLLSNKFNNTYNRHRGGLSYQYNDSIYNLTIGADIQTATLQGNQQFPYQFNVFRRFDNFLPNFNLNIKPNRVANMRFVYRTSTNIPGIQQLQEVIDNSNPLQLSTGNANLDQSFIHTVIARIGLTQAGGTKTLFFVNFANFTQNFIANQTIIPVSDTSIFLGNDSLRLRRGVQLSRPVNMNGNIMYRSFINYGMPIKALKSNLNLSIGYVFQRSPGMINDIENITNTHAINGGLVLGSNINENIDFTISYNNSYNIVSNKIQPQLNNTFFNQTVNGKFNIVVKQNLVINSDISHILFTGLEQGFNQQFLLWNASVGYRMLKNRQGELKLSVFDLLNQNNNVSRNVTETYIEDQRNLILRQYFMLTFTYNLRYFKI
ncbi:MAG: outer membrane beta-barrel protein [Bacteroidia bacterium]